MRGEPLGRVGTRWVKTCWAQKGFSVIGALGDVPKAAAQKVAPAKSVPAKAASASPQKAPAAPSKAVAAGGSDELEALKKQIADKKAALKASGMSGGAINKDADVMAMVKRLQELKAAEGAAPAAPAKAASPQKAPAAAPEGPKSDKQAAKKAAKEAEKAKKEAEKAARLAEQQKAKEVPAPNVTLLDFDQHVYGNMLIRSEKRTGRVFVKVGGVGEYVGKQIWVRARISQSRKQG